MALDIDNSSINKKFQIVPDDTQDNIISWFKNDVKKDVPKHKTIDPFPGVCIKTWTESGDKVFVNLCHSKDIAPPDDISNEKFLEVMTEENPSFVIPMAIGLEKMAKDKSDIERTTFDILINTTFFEKCNSKPLFLNFTIAAILESLNDKYKKDIITIKYVVLQNRKVMGSLDKFTIEDRKPKLPEVKKPLIQLIDVPEDEHKKPKNIDTSFAYHPKINNYVTVDVGDNRIIVENQKADIIIDTFLPCCIDNNNVIANFDSKLHILCLTLPIKSKLFI